MPKAVNEVKLFGNQAGVKLKICERPQSKYVRFGSVLNSANGKGLGVSKVKLVKFLNFDKARTRSSIPTAPKRASDNVMGKVGRVEPCPGAKPEVPNGPSSGRYKRAENEVSAVGNRIRCPTETGTGVEPLFSLNSVLFSTGCAMSVTHCVITLLCAFGPSWRTASSFKSTVSESSEGLSVNLTEPQRTK